MTILTPFFSPDLRHISHQGKEFREYLSQELELEEDTDIDEWRRLKLLIYIRWK